MDRNGKASRDAQGAERWVGMGIGEVQMRRDV